MVEDKVGMEVSKDQMKMFTAGSNNEGTKILSRIGDDKKGE